MNGSAHQGDGEPDTGDWNPHLRFRLGALLVALMRVGIVLVFERQAAGCDHETRERDESPGRGDRFTRHAPIMGGAAGVAEDEETGKPADRLR
jgi:hypothetical protein